MQSFRSHLAARNTDGRYPRPTPLAKISQRSGCTLAYLSSFRTSAQSYEALRSARSVFSPGAAGGQERGQRMLAWGSDYEELTMAVDRCVSRPYVGLPPYRESGYPLPLVAAEVQPMKSRFTFPKSAQLTLRTGQTFRLLRSHSAHLNKDRLVRTSTHRQCAESPCHLFISPQAQALLCQPRQYPLMIFFLVLSPSALCGALVGARPAARPRGRVVA